MSRGGKKFGLRSPTLVVLVLLLALVLVLSISSVALADVLDSFPGTEIPNGGNDGYCGDKPTTTQRTVPRTTTTTAPSTTTSAATTSTTGTTAPTTSTTIPTTVTMIDTGGGGTAGVGAGQWALAILAGALGVGLITSAVRVRQKAK